MVGALRGPAWPIPFHCSIFVSAAFVLFLGAFINGITAILPGPQQSPRIRLEQMVRGTIVTDSSTSLIAESERNGGVIEPEIVASLGPADRFRLIVQLEAQEEGAIADLENAAAVLHPVRRPMPRRKSLTGSTYAKIAAGVLPSAALFSQVLMGSRMKASVLEDTAFRSLSIDGELSYLSTLK